MEDKLIKKAFIEMKRKLPKASSCTDEWMLCRYAEDTLEEKESERVEEHLVLCATCCDCLVSLNKMIQFAGEEVTPEVSEELIKRVSALIKRGEEGIYTKRMSGILRQIAQLIKELFKFDWIVLPMPVAVRSGIVSLLVVLMGATVFLYLRPSGIVPIDAEIEVVAKSRLFTTRGGLEGAPLAQVIKDGDTLYANDYCRISFELDRDGYAYVVLYDSSGKLHKLYPDPSLAPPQKVKGKIKYTVPTGESKWLQLDEHTGKETVFVLGSHKPISNLGETINVFQGLNRDEILKIFKRKAEVVKVFSFNHQ